MNKFTVYSYQFTERGDTDAFICQLNTVNSQL